MSRRAEIQVGQDPHNQCGDSQVEGIPQPQWSSLKTRGVWIPHQVSQTRGLTPGRGSPHNIYLSEPTRLSRNERLHSLRAQVQYKLTHYKSQHWGSNWKSTWINHVGIILTSFRASSCPKGNNGNFLQGPKCWQMPLFLCFFYFTLLQPSLPSIGQCKFWHSLYLHPTPAFIRGHTPGFVQAKMTSKWFQRKYAPQPALESHISSSTTNTAGRWTQPAAKYFSSSSSIGTTSTQPWPAPEPPQSVSHSREPLHTKSSLAVTANSHIQLAWGHPTHRSSNNNYSATTKRVHTIHTGPSLEHVALVTRKNCTTGPQRSPCT